MASLCTRRRNIATSDVPRVEHSPIRRAFFRCILILFGASEAKNVSRSAENALHSNNVWWIVSETPVSQQGHVALRTRSTRAALLRSGWHPTRNLVLSLRPSRSEHGHERLRYSGSPNRALSTQTFIFRRVDEWATPWSNSTD